MVRDGAPVRAPAAFAADLEPRGPGESTIVDLARTPRGASGSFSRVSPWIAPGSFPGSRGPPG